MKDFGCCIKNNFADQIDELHVHVCVNCVLSDLTKSWNCDIKFDILFDNS